ncbi:MAG: hypothetical protein ACI85I_000956 [Arenicella sp.]|jgi:hypothetical protein
MNKNIALVAIALLVSVNLFGQTHSSVLIKESTLPEKPLVQWDYWYGQPWEYDVEIPLAFGSEEDFCKEFEKYIDEKFAPATAYSDECGDEAVSIREDLEIDEGWLTDHDYFALWDSQNLNSYGFDIKSFNEAVSLKLFDEAKEEGWSVPIKNTKINSKYGTRRSRWHHGSDLDLEIGDSVYAVFDGIVRIAKVNRGGYGNYVLVRHKNGLETLYGHLDEYMVDEGTVVKAGQIIGWGGNTGRSTGPHLHFEVRYNGHSLDPTHLFDFGKEEIVAMQDFTLTRDHFQDYIKSLEAQYHRIRRGDCLSIIARRYGSSISKICRLNGISRRTTLRIGRRLRVR